MCLPAVLLLQPHDDHAVLCACIDVWIAGFTELSRNQSRNVAWRAAKPDLNPFHIWQQLRLQLCFCSGFP
jgi:hypothetical protein